MPGVVGKDPYYKTHGFTYEPTSNMRKEEFPEHARLNEHTDENWAIRHFIEYLYAQGVFMARAGDGRTVHVPHAYIEGLLLAWRGVDVDDYEAERRLLNKRFGLDEIMEKLGGVKVRRKKPTWTPVTQAAPAKMMEPMVQVDPVEDDGLSLLMARVRGESDGDAAQG